MTSWSCTTLHLLYQNPSFFLILLLFPSSVELDNTFASIDVADSAGVVKDVVPCEAAQETSTQSLVEPDTLFYLPYQNIFLDGLPATRSKSQRIPSYLQQKDQPEREERKKLLRKLILERLLAFGTPNVTAHDITDTCKSASL